jgi:hypothetical protein
MYVRDAFLDLDQSFLFRCLVTVEDIHDVFHLGHELLNSPFEFLAALHFFVLLEFLLQLLEFHVLPNHVYGKPGRGLIGLFEHFFSDNHRLIRPDYVDLNRCFQ